MQIGAARAGRDIIVQFGLTAAPIAFQALVQEFVQSYLGTPEKPVPFGGRNADIRLLNTWLHDESAPHNLLITAPAGRGKTALLVRWIDQLNADWLPVFVPISIRFETNRAPIFYEAFAARLAEVLEEALPGTYRDPAVYYKSKVIEYLSRIADTGKRCLVVLDGLDEAAGWRVDKTVLPALPKKGLKIVVSARQLAGDHGSEDWLDRIGWSRDLDVTRTYEVPPLSSEGIADVLVKMGVSLADLAKDVDLIGELYRLTERGDPLLLELYVKDLWRGGKDAVRLKPRDLAKLIPGFGAYFKQWFRDQREAWEEIGAMIDQPIVDAMLAILACAFGPLKLPTLEDLLDRIHPGQRIFTAHSINPLRRFVIGDGVTTGYVLAHPKLAEYLRRDYFGGSKVLETTAQAFVDWGRDVVRALNEGRLAPEKAPRYEYVLLHYTQHLEAMGSPEDALLLYRELVEDGWRRAWYLYEGGYQGFSRDVELAADALRLAAAQDLGQLKAPRIGLAGQIRCMLCLSSIISSGLGTPGEVLVEFLRDGIVSPKQALYLALLKDEKQRGDAVGAIVPFLSTELRLEAYAALRDMRVPSAQNKALVAIAPHLPARERDKAYVGAFEAAMRCTESFERTATLQELEPLLPDWFDAKGEREKAETRSYAEPAHAGTSAHEATSPLTLGANGKHTRDRDDEDNWIPMVTGSLIEEVARGDVSPEQMPQVLAFVRSEQLSFDAIGALERYGAHLPTDFLSAAIASGFKYPFGLEDKLKVLVPFLSKAQLQDVLERLFNIEDTYVYVAPRVLDVLAPYLSENQITQALGHEFKYVDPVGELGISFATDVLEVLAPYLSENQITHTLGLVFRWSDFELGKGLEALLPVLSKEKKLLIDVLDRLSAIRNSYASKEALSRIAPILPQELLPMALDVTFGETGYYFIEMLRILGPHLPRELLADALDRSSTTEGERGADSVVVALVAYLPNDIVPTAMRMAIRSNGARLDDALEALAPRLSEDLIREAFALLKAGQANGLKGLAPHLPADLLRPALTMASNVMAMERRGALFAILLPRIREKGLPTGVEDAYEVAFLIADDIHRMFALAALAPYLAPQTSPALVKTMVSELVAEEGRTPDDDDMFALCATCALLADGLPAAQAKRMLEQALAAAHRVNEPLVKALVLGFLSQRMTSVGGNPTLSEALEMARQLDGAEAIVVKAILAPLCSETEAAALLAEANAGAKTVVIEDEERAMLQFAIALSTSIMPNRSAQQRLAALAEVRHIIAGEGDRLEEEIRAMVQLLTAILSPELPAQEWLAMLNEAKAAVEKLDDALAVLGIALIAPYVQTADLGYLAKRLLEVGARLPRPSVLGALALVQGLTGELYRGNPVIAGNRIPGGPLERLGGPGAVDETFEAIQDVCRWWP